MFPLAMLKLPVAGATATWALAIPALNRGTSLSFSPRFQSLVFYVPFFRSTITFLLAATSTSPDQTVLPWCSHGQVMLSGREQEILMPDPVKLNSSTWPTK